MSRREPAQSDTPRTEWKAYSDYNSVSERVADSIADAVDSLSTIAAKGVANETQKNVETQNRSAVLSAVTFLRTELENERDSKEVYDEILTRWEGQEGHLQLFRTMDIRQLESEPWLQQFAEDIHRAGWELGYLKAGREEKKTSGGDPYDGQVRDMFKSE